MSDAVTQGYVTYVVTEDELRQACVLYNSIRVFDKRTPFYFVSPGDGLAEANFRRLDDMYPKSDFRVVPVAWPEPGIPYKSIWQLPHTLVDVERVLFLSCNTVINRDLSWLFGLFQTYATRLGGAVGFGTDSHTGELISDVFMYERSTADTWVFFEQVRDLKVSSWREGAFYLAKSWNTIVGLKDGIPTPAFKLYPLTFLTVSPTMLTKGGPVPLVNGLPTVQNLRILPSFLAA
jgi:hypothetical protein